MYNSQALIRGILFLFISLLLTNCGGGGSSDTASATGTTPGTAAGTTSGTTGTGDPASDPKYALSYKGLTFYYQGLTPSQYKLDQLTNDEFNTLGSAQKLQVANKLLSTLFFGYPQKELQAKIDSDNFINGVRSGLEEDKTDKAWLENYILDENKFRQYSSYNEPQAINILSRFYAMKNLDSYFFKNWVAYILTQTIMFSPAY